MFKSRPTNFLDCTKLYRFNESKASFGIEWQRNNRDNIIPGIKCKFNKHTSNEIEGMAINYILYIINLSILCIMNTWLYVGKIT